MSREEGNVDGITQLLVWFGKLFVPPHDANPRAHMFWRWRVAGFLCTSFAICVWFLLESHTPALAKTYVDPLVHESELTQFVKKEDDDHKETINEIHEARAASIETEIATLRPLHCKSTGDSRGLYWDRISHLMVRYQELVSRPYPLPNCPEIQ